MCGIFGLVRNAGAPNPERATAVLVELGRHSVSRGRDSAGVAFIPRDATSAKDTTTRTQADSTHVRLQGGTVITKDTQTFHQAWDDERDVKFAAHSSVMIGHTRAATQGSKSDKTNTSPLAVGTLVGTHNGDIDANSVDSWRVGDRNSFGRTDTEALYRAINSVKSHRAKITSILTEAKGRIALAWYDRRTPGRMFLARGGLSPMSIAFDAEGNMYWASSPQWFRDIDEKFEGAIGFTDIFMVPEGNLMTVEFADGTPRIADRRIFTPTVRQSDTYLPDSIVWRGFNEDDKAMDKNSSSHKIAPEPVRRYGSGWSSGGGTTSKTTTVTTTSTTVGSENYDWVDKWIENNDKLLKESDTAEGEFAYEFDEMEEFEELEVIKQSLSDSEAQVLADVRNEITSLNHSRLVPVLETFLAAERNLDYEGIVKDFNLPSEEVAILLVNDIINESLAESK